MTPFWIKVGRCSLKPQIYLSPGLGGPCYLLEATAFSRLEWHIRAEEATMAF